MESLLLGHVAMRIFDEKEKAQLRFLFPHSGAQRTPLNGPPACAVLKAGQVMRAIGELRRQGTMQRLAS